jgi:hypothetical protein
MCSGHGSISVGRSSELFRGEAIMVSRLGVLLIASVLWGRTLNAQNCRTSDPYIEGVRQEIARYSSANSGDNKAVRDSLKLPFVVSSQVVLVSSDATCKKARTAFQSYWANRGGTGFSAKVYVLQVGSLYAVVDSAYRYRAANPYSPVLFLDSRFKSVSVY